MARFHDKVGFLIPYDNQETGMAGSTPVERPYYGKIRRHVRRWEFSEHTNNDLKLSNEIAITANDYAFEHMSAIAYVHFMGGWWEVTSVEVKAPELILSIGGVWNGPTVAAAETAGTGSESLVPEATDE